MNLTRLFGTAALAAAFAMNVNPIYADGDIQGFTYKLVGTSTTKDGTKVGVYDVYQGDVLNADLIAYKWLSKDGTAILKVETAGNPAPDSDDPYGSDKPIFAGGGKSPLAPGAWEEQIDPDTMKYTEEGFEIEKGILGLGGIQARGGIDELINPPPDDTGGGKKDTAKKKKLGGDDKLGSATGMKLDAQMQQLLNEQMPGVNVSLVGQAYIQLHNPGDDTGDYEPPKPPGSTGGKGPKPVGGGDDTKTTGGGGDAGPGGAGGQAAVQPQGEAAAYMASLVNPDPFASGGDPFGMQDLTAATEIDKALLGDLPMAPPVDVFLPGQGAVAAGPDLGPSQAQIAPMSVQGSRAAPGTRGEQAPVSGQAPSAFGPTNCPPPCE